ncbi:hypothetical protein Tco_0190529 [Tanacetum coccineum]
MSVFLDTKTGQGVDQTIVAGLMDTLDQKNVVAQSFRMARDWCHSHESVNFELRLLSNHTSARQYNAPIVSEVAALITNDFGYSIPSRDIVVDNKDEGPKRISELHPSYMALQYPLLFPYREDGYHEKIPYHTNRGTRKTKRGRLYQQFLVDAFTAIEEQRLKWTINNQDSLRVDLYHNLNDAFTRGDTNAEGLGKPIVLPRTFTGGPRYLMQNYQDAMALCRAYENPNLFITFTSNLKWPEIAEMLSFIPDQKPYEHRKKSCAVVYGIEFQKRGLPHAHILLWLKEEWKCQTPSQVDNIISAEMPSLTNDPEGYKVFIEFMLHDPCGKEAACTIDGKCSKKYHKPFYLETNLDEDGYPVYSRKDSKIQAVKGPDRATFVIQENVQNGPLGELQKQENSLMLKSQSTMCGMKMKRFRNPRNKKSIGRIYYLNPAAGDRYYLRMLLNVTRGPQGFKELMTVNKKLYPTFKAACFAYGLLNDDKEWAHAINEASFWALAPQLHDLFVIMLLFYDVSRPLRLWEET